MHIAELISPTDSCIAILELCSRPFQQYDYKKSLQNLRQWACFVKTAMYPYSQIAYKTILFHLVWLQSASSFKNKWDIFLMHKLKNSSIIRNWKNISTDAPVCKHYDPCLYDDMEKDVENESSCSECENRDVL